MRSRCVAIPDVWLLAQRPCEPNFLIILYVGIPDMVAAVLEQQNSRFPVNIIKRHAQETRRVHLVPGELHA